MKERLLRLQTVSDRCREEEGGQEQNWTEEYRKQMCRKAGAVLEVTAAVGGQKSMSFTSLFLKETLNKLYLIIKDVTVVIINCSYYDKILVTCFCATLQRHESGV